MRRSTVIIMKGIDLLKMALAEGVAQLPANFIQDNEIEAKFLGINGAGDRLYYVPELDKKVYQAQKWGA